MSGEAKHGGSPLLTVSEFLATPQIAFGLAWRYELIDGMPVERPAPTGRHALILKNLSEALKLRLHSRSDCASRADASVIPSELHRRNVRFPDVTVRRGERPVAMFEIVSPLDDGASALQKAWRRIQLKTVWGAEVLVEIEQDAPIIHVHRRLGDLWAYDDLIGPEERLSLEVLGVEIQLSEIYDKLFDPAGRDEAGLAGSE
jgi:Uma2 family endonuclease